MTQEGEARIPAFVELVTFGHVASGRSERIDERVRLIDLLAGGDEHLVLRDAVVQAVRPGLPIIAEVDPLLVSRRHVVLATVIEPANVVRLRRELHRTELVEKVAHPVTVFAPPYRVEGLLHLAPEVTLSRYLPKLLTGFFALTAAVILHEQGALHWRREIVVVNGSVAQLVCPQEAVRSEERPTGTDDTPRPPRSPFAPPDDAA